MISFDREWLEKVRGSIRSIYAMIPLEERARGLHDILEAYLGVAVNLVVRNITPYPWISISHRVAGPNKWRRDMPVGPSATDITDFDICVSPKFLKIEKEEDALTLLDFVIFGDLKSRKRFIDAFSGPQFRLGKGKPGRRALSPVGKVYNLEPLGRGIERTYFRLKSIPFFTFDTKRYTKRLACYDKSRDQIIVNPLLDHPDVPVYVIEKTLFHELLHTFFKEGLVRPHCLFANAMKDYERFLSEVYPPHIAEELFVRQAESRYDHYEKASSWLRSNLGNHVLKFPRKPRRRKGMVEVFLSEKEAETD